MIEITTDWGETFLALYVEDLQDYHEDEPKSIRVLIDGGLYVISERLIHSHNRHSGGNVYEEWEIIEDEDYDFWNKRPTAVEIKGLNFDHPILTNVDYEKYLDRMIQLGELEERDKRIWQLQEMGKTNDEMRAILSAEGFKLGWG